MSDNGQTYASTSERRIERNAMRHTYRVLTDAEKLQMSRLKDLGQALLDALSSLGASREISIARTKTEEAVMWGCKHITR